MNALVKPVGRPSAEVKAAWEDATGEAWESVPHWELKALKPVHRQIAALLAQGAKNVEAATLCNVTPEYVSMLLRQPLMKAHIAEICEHAGIRMEALFEKSVEVIANALTKGSVGDQLKAARLQLEATKRLGRGDGPTQVNVSVDRLEVLAQRLVLLQSNVHKPRVYEHEQGQTNPSTTSQSCDAESGENPTRWEGNETHET